ncbi:MAG TPA: ATP-binding protein [Gemmatimonadaceae bacterium]|nr:ATP-binding protein [Gemmatimonadaceae bacterium]
MRTPASIRTTLSAWYAGAFALLLSAFAVGAYLFLQHQTQQRIDEYLAETAGAVAGAMEFERVSNKAFDQIVDDVLEEFRMQDIAVLILDRERNRISMLDLGARRRATPPRMHAAQQLPDLRTILTRTRPTDETTFETGLGDGGPVRIVALPYRLGTRDVVIGAARSLEGQEKTLREARYAIGFGIPFMLIVATAGGSLLARKSLAPVAAMAEQAARISATSLHERVAVPNPRDELGRLASVLNDLLERLDRSFEEQRRFTADASHELRTPVAIISGEAELALSREGRSPSELRDALARVRAESDRLKHIVDDLFLLARAEAGDPIMVPREVYLGEVAADSVRALRSLAEQKMVRLAFEGSEDLPFQGDEALLRRLFVNLLDNAIKYTPAGGDVTMSAERQNGNYLVTVADTGPGIPVEAQPHIFDRFYRSERDRRESATGGAGLGLAIASWIVQTHGGTLGLDRSDASGSRFVVRLPVSE